MGTSWSLAESYAFDARISIENSLDLDSNFFSSESSSSSSVPNIAFGSSTFALRIGCSKSEVLSSPKSSLGSGS